MMFSVVQIKATCANYICYLKHIILLLLNECNTNDIPHLMPVQCAAFRAYRGREVQTNIAK